MSYATDKGIITAKKGKAADAPSVYIQDPLYRENPVLQQWVDAYGEEAVQTVFLQARQVIIQRVGRSILNDDGNNTVEAQDAMIAQAKNISLRRIGHRPPGVTKKQTEEAMVAAGYSLSSPKVQKMLSTMFPEAETENETENGAEEN